MSTVLVSFHHDLRLDHHPALACACRECGVVVPAVVLDTQAPAYRAPGAASNWYLHHSLSKLQESIKRLGSKLVLRTGDLHAEVLDLLDACNADTVFWNRSSDPAERDREDVLIAKIQARGLSVRTFHCDALFAPGSVLNKQGTPYKVFTPFYKACLALGPPKSPLPAPTRIPAASMSIRSLELQELGLLPTQNWAAGFPQVWTPGEEAAHEGLHNFLETGLASYAHARDELGRYGTSRLSAALHVGEMSVRRIWHVLASQGGAVAAPYLRQLVWRDFARSLLYHAPHTVTEPLNEKFSTFPWRVHAGQLKAWQQGRTGYPVVDAGMRELWQTGYMHNRARMITGSFLVKDLRMQWRAGERWFWDTLVDADLANNVMGWQWISGCGADAAPYFRIFNPVSQGQKFDPAGEYVRRWVPELTRVPNRWLHCPWTASAADLKEWGVYLGRTYPLPVVDHAEARKEALRAWQSIR